MTKAQQYRDQSTEELEATSRDTRRELFTIANEKQQTKKLEKPHRLKEARRQNARILTILNQRKRQAQQEGS